MFANYHTHTHFSDGDCGPETYIAEAIRQGLPALGISDHAPFAVMGQAWAMPEHHLESYVEQLAFLKKKYAGQIELYTGIEVDFVPHLISLHDGHLADFRFDYSIGTLHYVDSFRDGLPWCIDDSPATFAKGLREIFKNDVRAAVERYFELLEQMCDEACPDIIGDFDRIRACNARQQFFDEEAGWYQDAVRRSLFAIAESGAILEVSTKGMYRQHEAQPSPQLWVLREASSLGIPVQLGSDAHHPGQLTAAFGQAAAHLRRAGHTHVRLLLQNRWQDVALQAQPLRVAI